MANTHHGDLIKQGNPACDLAATEMRVGMERREYVWKTECWRWDDL